MDNQSAPENAGFTGAGFTGEGFTGQPAQGGDGGGAGGGAGGGGGGDGGLGELEGDDYDLGADPLMGEESVKNGAKGMLIVVLVVGLAAGSLFSMHTLTKVTAAAGKNAEIDKTVDKFLNSLAGSENPANPDGTAPALVQGHQEILDTITNNYVENQVELDRNPFALSGSAGGGSSGGDPGLSRSAVQRAFEKLDLKSVIGGSRPLANINGKIVRVNQVMPVRLSKVEGDIKFRVKEITRDSVTVEAVEIELEKPFVKKIVLKRRR